MLKMGVARQSGTVEYSRDRPMFGFGFGPKETVYLSDLESSETLSLLNRTQRKL